MTMQDLINIEEIKQLRAKYSHYMDTLQKEKLMDLFSDDYILETEASFAVPPMNKESWEKNIEALFVRHELNEMFHAVSTPLIEIIDDNNATGVWYLLDYDSHFEQKLRVIGTYHDQYRKENGEWKISKTLLRVKWPKNPLR